MGGGGSLSMIDFINSVGSHEGTFILLPYLLYFGLFVLCISPVYLVRLCLVLLI